MGLFFIVISIHFIAGAAGILHISRTYNSAQRKAIWLKYIWYLVIFLIIISSIFAGKAALTGLTIIIFSGCIFELLRLKDQSEAGRSGSSFLFYLLLAGFLSIVALLFSLFICLPEGVILFTYSIVIVFDGASQITGQMMGKTKILPVISPGKTLEGLLGGIFSALITSAFLHHLISVTMIQSVVAGMAVSLASFIGDMIASMYKRRFGEKDFGNILPGQGGLLDRFDSFIFSGAIIGLINLIFRLVNFEFDANLLYYLGYSSLFLIILLIGEIIYSSSGNHKAEISRIFSHLACGLACIFLIKVFSSPWYVVVLCIQSSLFIVITKRMGLFRSHHGVARETNGSVFFFFGILVAYLTSLIARNYYLYYLPVAILTISDPIASLTGMNVKSPFWPNFSSGRKSSKTIYGSMGFFMTASIILISGLPEIVDLSDFKVSAISLIIAAITTIVEAYSYKGSDNLFIPVIVAASLLIIAPR